MQPTIYPHVVHSVQQWSFQATGRMDSLLCHSCVREGPNEDQDQGDGCNGQLMGRTKHTLHTTTSRGVTCCHPGAGEDSGQASPNAHPLHSKTELRFLAVQGHKSSNCSMKRCTLLKRAAGIRLTLKALPARTEFFLFDKVSRPNCCCCWLLPGFHFSGAV